MSEANPFTAIVTAIPVNEELVNEIGDEVENAWEAILNTGAADDVRLGQTFLIFSLGPDVRDHITGKSLGKFEVVRGQAKVTHVQELMCTIRSLNTKRVPVNPFANITPSLASPRSKIETYEEATPFALLAVGDYARRI